MKLGFLISALTVATPLHAACGLPHLLGKTGTLVHEFNSCRTDGEVGVDATLELTTFNLLNGQTRLQAFAVLSDQGFVCKDETCTLVSTSRETNFDRWFGLHSLNPMAKNKRYWHRSSYIISLNGDTILKSSDVTADFLSETALVAWPRRPQAEDYEIKND
ncbi:MAG: hypothetical protein KBT70_04555 [Roseovarius sp.]|uniref:hypothetical protein n=1 Tax=Roseovarius sp. TaxID=1486281 RepID=UPI001B49D924|nr:hypothetical protein [Roseovarius sp.]MBQ0749451.1 hypothetical protein [Roseovarius sp.]MBQ0809412.1 hypothetical protein [Roseovarius sp.]